MNIWFVVAANILVPGAGYVILGKRKTFGWLLFASSLIAEIRLYVDPLPDVYIYGSNPWSIAFGIAAIFLGAAAFGYDAYKLAKET